ncbi:MAG: hypothetical protein RL154_1379 [Pseudomonadota bacterium]
MSIFSTKPLNIKHGNFERRLGPLSLTAIGVGATIGAGIFVVTGKAAATMAGPAIMLAFLFAALSLSITALVYAELGSNIPIAGGAYSYTYSALGELMAWLVGWNLLLEYGLCVSAVATGWSGYFRGFVEHALDIKFITAISGPFSPQNGTYIDLFAMLMSALIFTLVYFGIKKSSFVNNIVVAIKMFVLLVFLFVGFKYINFDNLKDFMPFGWHGVWEASSLMVFAYLGFDAISTVAEETKNPSKNMPIGLIGSLGLSALLYLVVSFVITAIIPYSELNVPDALSYAMYKLNEPFVGSIIALGAVITITSVMLVMSIGFTRVAYALARDGFLFKAFAQLCPKTHTPKKATVVTGIFITLLSAFIPLGVLAEMINIGTLFAFFCVGISLMVLRKRQDYKTLAYDGFKIPYANILLPLNLVFLAIMAIGLTKETWIRFFVWGAIGLIIYFGYSKKQLIKD